MICQNCNTENPENSTVCHKCYNIFLTQTYILPIIKFTQKLIIRLMSNEISVDKFEEELMLMKKFLENQLKEAENIETINDIEIAVIAKNSVLKGTEGLIEGVNELLKFSMDNKPARLKNGLEILVRSGKNLVLFNIIRDTINNSMPAKVICLFCGADNNTTLNFCSRCNKKLPKPGIKANESIIEFNESELNEKQSSNYLELKETVENFFEKKIDKDNALNKINSLLKFLEHSLSQINSNLPKSIKKEEDIFTDIKENFENYIMHLRNIKESIKKDKLDKPWNDLNNIKSISAKLIDIYEQIEKNQIVSR